MAQRRTQSTSKTIMQGLVLCGTVIDRTRRMVPRDNPTTEIVTYTIQDDFNHKFYVDDYSPSEYHDLNAKVCLPIYVKAYSRKNGIPSYTLNVQKEDLVRGSGEHF